MKAFHNVRSEMRETCIEVSQPPTQEPARLARVMRLRRGHIERDEGESGTHIDPWMEAAFHGLTHASETGEPFALVSCFMNGKPAAVIALARPVGSKIHVMPLFLACQPWMDFGGSPESSGDEGGGPDRAAANDPPAPR